MSATQFHVEEISEELPKPSIRWLGAQGFCDYACSIKTVSSRNPMAPLIKPAPRPVFDDVRRLALHLINGGLTEFVLSGNYLAYLLCGGALPNDIDIFIPRNNVPPITSGLPVCFQSAYGGCGILPLDYVVHPAVATITDATNRVSTFLFNSSQFAAHCRKTDRGMYVDMGFYGSAHALAYKRDRVHKLYPPRLWGATETERQRMEEKLKEKQGRNGRPAAPLHFGQGSLRSFAFR